MKKQTIKINEYIKQLETENIMLKEQNKKLQHRVLFGCQQENVSLLQKELLIQSLKKELAKARQQNAMLLLTR